MRKLSWALLPAILAVSFLFVPSVARAQPCAAGAICGNSAAASGANAAAAPTKAPAPAAAPAKPAAVPLAAPGGPAAARLAWIIVALITLIALAVALYPIIFYVRQAWRSRQKAIFETLSTAAKRQYLLLYRASEAGALDTAAEVEAAFSTVYYRWFGKGRLVTPSVIIALVILAYVFLAAVRAAQGLLPQTWQPPFAIPDTALAAIAGAYILVTMDTIGRVVRRDLLPEDLQLTALRLISCVPLGYAFASLAQPAVGPFIALAITAIPLQQAAVLLGQLAGKQLGVAAPAAAGPSPDAPSQLSGVDAAVCERLSAIGVNTITQVAYSDPVQLTMRTSLNFVYILDVVSQALAWVYLDQQLNAIRPMGLRGAFEIAALKHEADAKNPNALAVIAQLPTVLKTANGITMTTEQCQNLLHQIADDPYTDFLLVAYS